MDLRATMLCCLFSLAAVLASCEHRQRQCGNSEDIGRVLALCNTLIQSVLEPEGDGPSELTPIPEPSKPTPIPDQPEHMTEPPLPIGSLENPASSCSNIPQGSPSGEYFIQLNATGEPIQVYCDMERTSCSCNASQTSRWMKVVDLNFTNTDQSCPNGFQLREPPQYGRRSCGGYGHGCVSTTFSTNGIEYSHVCGKVIGYQYGSPDAFNPYFAARLKTVGSLYLDGISLTHGQSPRRHIWSFVSAADETISDQSHCPCSTSNAFTGVIPPFVGQDYFCETGSREHWQFIFYPDDPLWDGQGCGGTSTCCQFNNPPWFCKQLPQLTTDDIELRLCTDEAVSNEDIALELVKIFVR